MTGLTLRTAHYKVPPCQLPVMQPPRREGGREGSRAQQNNLRRGHAAHHQ